jgi:hypothetical protein
MTEEQITNRYVRGWISLAQYRAELVALYDREDRKDAAAAVNALDHQRGVEEFKAIEESLA